MIFMGLLEGVGCGYSRCYPVDTKVAWLEINIIDLLKEMFLCDWNLAKDEHISSLKESG